MLFSYLLLRVWCSRWGVGVRCWFCFSVLTHQKMAGEEKSVGTHISTLDIFDMCTTLVSLRQKNKNICLTPFTPHNSLGPIQFTPTKAKSIHLCLTLVRVSMTLLFWDLESPKLWTLKAQTLKSEEPSTSHTPMRKGSRRRVKGLMAQSWDSDLMCGDKDRPDLIDWHLQFVCTRTTEATL